MDELRYSQIIEYYSGLKRNEPSDHEKTWGNLKCLLFSERGQSEGATALCFYLYTFWKSNMGTVKRSGVESGEEG